jgi:hypothetical protein
MEKEIDHGYAPDSEERALDIHEAPLDAVPKSRWERSWPVIAAGSGLFSDGYLNGVRHHLFPAALTTC